MDGQTCVIIVVGSIVGTLIGTPVGILLGTFLAEWWDARKHRRTS